MRPPERPAGSKSTPCSVRTDIDPSMPTTPVIGSAQRGCEHGRVGTNAVQFRRSSALTVAALIAAIAAIPALSWTPYLAVLLVIPLGVAVWAWRSGTDADESGLTGTCGAGPSTDPLERRRRCGQRGRPGHGPAHVRPGDHTAGGRGGRRTTVGGCVRSRNRFDIGRRCHRPQVTPTSSIIESDSSNGASRAPRDSARLCGSSSPCPDPLRVPVVQRRVDRGGEVRTVPGRDDHEAVTVP